MGFNHVLMGLGFWVWGYGFGVWGFGFGVAHVSDAVRLGSPYCELSQACTQTIALSVSQEESTFKIFVREGSEGRDPAWESPETPKPEPLNP